METDYLNIVKKELMGLVTTCFMKVKEKGKFSERSMHLWVVYMVGISFLYRVSWNQCEYWKVV